MIVTNSDWFEVWFDSPEYHLLYQHRDDSEAAGFISNIISFLDLKPGSKILDLACGRGRHSNHLAKFGYRVYGLDFAESNIVYARENYKIPHLQFFQHDMRVSFPVSELDLVLNMFTSFGYFNSQLENEAVLYHVYESLNPGGSFIIDYFNTFKTLVNMVSTEIRTIHDLSFEIERKVEGRKIVKTISVSNSDQEKHFQERVEAFSLKELLDMIERAGFEVRNVFGDYDLNSYNEISSPRMIIHAVK